MLLLLAEGPGMRPEELGVMAQDPLQNKVLMDTSEVRLCSQQWRWCEFFCLSLTGWFFALVTGDTLAVSTVSVP